MKTYKILCFSMIGALMLGGCGDDDSKKKQALLADPVIVANSVGPIAKEATQELNTSLIATPTQPLIVSGATGDRLLKAFTLAMSQVIIEEGVVVPDCGSLADTGYLTKEECDGINGKYFGFYDFSEDGEVTKVGDSLASTILGEELKIRDGQINYFDNKNNPLLGDFVKLRSFIKNSPDITALRTIKQMLGNKSNEQIDKLLDDKIGRLAKLEPKDNEPLRTPLLDPTKKDTPKASSNNDNTNANKNTDNNQKQENNSALYEMQLASLKLQLEYISKLLANDPNNASLRAQQATLQSQLSSLKK